MISVPRFRRFLRTDSTQATQNFTIGVILDAESDGTKIFWKLEHFTILRNKVRVQPIEIGLNHEIPISVLFSIF